MLEPSTLVGFAAMITLTVTANLMLKLGAGAPEAQRIFGLIGGKSVAGLALFGCGGVVYSFLLRRLPLNIAKCLRQRSLSGSSLPPAWCWVSRFRPRAGWVSSISASGSSWSA
jgi:hypothetical protein